MTHTEEENFDLEFDPDGDNDGDDDNGNEMSNGKECTGRWTREEHQLFVKGLEAYGKGWKKIASLIKTRTVVQIRTHAQKYFLKLSKARQNGELAGGLGQYGFRKRRLRRRYGDRPISIAPMLQPFLKPSSSTENLEPADIEDGIYNFLSANLEVVSEEGVADSDETPNVSPPMELSEGDISSLALPSSPQSSSNLNRKKVDYKKLVPPLWYKKGQGLDVLLREAEGLDWSEDVQGRLENQNNGAETILTSNKTPAKEEKVEIEQNMQAGSEKRKASEESSQGTWRQKSGNTQGLQSESLHESKIRRLSSEPLTTLMNSYQAVEIHHSSPHNTAQKRRVEADDAVGFNIDEDIEQPLDNGGGHHNCHESSVADDHLDVFFDNSYFGLHGTDKDKTSTKTATFME